MFKKMLAAAVVLTVSFCALSTANAQNVSRQGTVSGTNTVDYVALPITPGTLYEVQIEVTNAGAGKLKSRIQYYLGSLTDAGYRDSGLAYYTRRGQTTTFRFRAIDVNPEGNEYYRLRLGRKIGTKRIDYSVRMSPVAE